MAIRWEQGPIKDTTACNRDTAKKFAHSSVGRYREMHRGCESALVILSVLYYGESTCERADALQGPTSHVVRPSSFW